MLVNFCDASLRTDVTCSTVSTEGYEVTNLVNNSEKGFLAYSCIKPPITIDFVFICNIQIHHVIIWPQVGAQKSCGFQLSIKSSDSNNQPFIDVSSAFLQKEESGVLFYRRDIHNQPEITVPSNFVKRYIKALNVANYSSSMRLKIIRTDNSVPAMGKIEIWGTVSPKCGKDVVSNVMALWLNRLNSKARLHDPSSAIDVHNEAKEERVLINNNLFDIPEEFLDPITCEIMTQPIILPSGKIIDQKTLEKHEHSEAIWGRSVSDPFTGIRFNDTHKPIAALPLKARIDKFLLENSNREEVKKLPRVLGSKTTQNCESTKIITCEIKDNNRQLKRTLSNEIKIPNNIKRPFYGHSLPVASVRNSSVTVVKKIVSECSKNVEKTVNSVSVDNCTCCSNSVYYKLPCEHVICRKALLALEESQCTLCKSNFERKDLQRYHTR